MELSYNKIFKVNQLALKYNRSDPNIPKDMKWLIQFTLIFGSYCCTLPLFFYSIVKNLKAKDFSKTCEDATFLVVFSVVSFLYFVTIWKEKTLIEIMNSIKSDYELAKYLNLEERDIVLKYAKNGGLIGKQWFLQTLLVTSAFYIKNFYFYFKNFLNGKFEFIPIYEQSYPTFINNRKDDLTCFICLYLMMVHYFIYSASIYVSFVPLGPSFMLHACGQLEILSRRMDNVFVNRNKEGVILELRDIIKRLQYIYSFVQKINECFLVAYDLVLKSTAVFLPVVLFEIIEIFGQGRVSLEFITFFFGGILIISYPCYYGELLMKKGEEFRLSVYFCGWERFYDRRTRSTITLILQRALRPIAIRTLFRIVSLDALAEVFHQSYALFSLMNAMWN